MNIQNNLPPLRSSSTIRPNFRAIYADRAVSQACVGCHNTHPRSPKKDFKMGDVMGGLVIEIPLEK